MGMHLDIKRSAFTNFPYAIGCKTNNTGDVIEYGRTMVDLRMEAEDLDVVTTAGADKVAEIPP